MRKCMKMRLNDKLMWGEGRGIERQVWVSGVHRITASGWFNPCDLRSQAGKLGLEDIGRFDRRNHVETMWGCDSIAMHGASVHRISFASLHLKTAYHLPRTSGKQLGPGIKVGHDQETIKSIDWQLTKRKGTNGFHQFCTFPSALSIINAIASSWKLCTRLPIFH